MHWRALQHSESTRSRHISQLDGRHSNTQPPPFPIEHTAEPDEREYNVPYGNDDAADIKSDCPRPDVPILMPNNSYSEPEVDQENEDSLPVQIPFFTNGVCTEAYQRALQNRIRNGDIRPHGCWDMTPFKPVFFHDILMQPGSLANIMGGLSPEQLIERMTPALLPGHFPHVDPDSHQPRIIHSPNPEDYVQGMLLFGEGKNGRRAIHYHYDKPGTRRTKVPVQIDVLVPANPEDRSFACQRWKLQRRTIMARVWLSSSVLRPAGAHASEPATSWTLERYLGGEFSPKQRLDVRSADEWEDREVDVVEPESEGEEMEEREVVGGGSGHLDYERCEGWGGW